jgi:hypothetical protein
MKTPLNEGKREYPPGKRGQGDRTAVTYPDPRQFEREPEPDPVAGGDPAGQPGSGKWKQGIREWVAHREKERESDFGRLRDECGRDVRKGRMPRPWLDATSNFGPQITALRAGEAGEVSFTVWNEGSYPAWSCYVELYEGPGGYTSPLSDYTLRGRRIITLHPGERRDVSVPWVRTQNTGRIVGVIHDPLLDPRDFDVVEQFNRHITSVHYSNLE